MVNDVINAVTEAIAAEFPSEDGYDIYVGDVPQGFDPKTFIVTSVMPSRDKKSHSAYEYDELIAVQYNPLNGHDEINDVVTRLQDCLEIINVTHGSGVKPTRTTQTDVAEVDGVLTYVVRVADIYFRQPGGDMMTDMELDVMTDMEVTNG